MDLGIETNNSREPAAWRGFPNQTIDKPHLAENFDSEYLPGLKENHLSSLGLNFFNAKAQATT
jgi:hypothetical protein